MPDVVQTETAYTNLLHRKAKAERVNRPSTLRHEYGIWALVLTTSALHYIFITELGIYERFDNIYL